MAKKRKNVDTELEKKVEQYLIQEIRKLGGLCYKWSSYNVRGVPDRVIFMPQGKVYFVEVKRLTGKVTLLQRHNFNAIRNLGTPVFVVYGISGVDEFIKKEITDAS